MSASGDLEFRISQQFFSHLIKEEAHRDEVWMEIIKLFEFSPWLFQRFREAVYTLIQDFAFEMSEEIAQDIALAGQYGEVLEDDTFELITYNPEQKGRVHHFRQQIRALMLNQGDSRLSSN